METYLKLKERQAKEVSDFPYIFWAFNKKQFNEGIKKLAVTEKNKIIPIGMGGYVLSSRAAEFSELLDRHKAELEKLKDANEEAKIKALIFELEDHEYQYSNDITQSLQAVGLDIVKDAEIIKRALKIFNRRHRDR